MKSVKGDVWLAIVVIAGAAIYLYLDLQLPEVRLSDPLGPKAFPALVGVGLISSALLLLFEGHSKARHAAHTERPASGKASEANGQKQPETAAPKAAQEAQADASGALHKRTSGAVASTAKVEAAAAASTDREHTDHRANAATTSNANPKKLPRYVLVGMLLWTVAYYFCFDRAGYLLSTSVFLLGLLSYFNRKRYKTNIAIAIGVAVVLDLLFSQLLSVPMPQGILPF
jgi:putative tricarboxylic transport membrane protein